MVKNIIVPGDQYAEKGTTAWADWQRSRMKHALKDVNFEARQIVQVIRDMCAGKKPAWHLMTRYDGVGFRTFEEFVTSSEGLTYPDYAKFRNLAVSEPGIMNEREYDLLTAAPLMKAGRKKEERNPVLCIPDYSSAELQRRKRLRSINRAPSLVRKLYVGGLIDAKLAELLGPDPGNKGFAERKQKADRALAAIQSITRNGSDVAYRKAVNDAVRKTFGLEKMDDPFARIVSLLPKLNMRQTDRLRRMLDAL